MVVVVAAAMAVVVVVVVTFAGGAVISATSDEWAGAFRLELAARQGACWWELSPGGTGQDQGRRRRIL